MMKISTDIGIIDFLNHFSWRSLDCFHKPFSIISENLVKNSSYYYLLFKPYLPDFERFIVNETGITNSLYCSDKNKFLITLEDLITQNTYSLLITNQYYNELDYMYNKKHHKHPIILKEYDRDTEEFTIMDENYATSKFGGAVEYIFRNINKNQLEKLCCDLSKTDFITPNMSVYEICTEDSFCYMKFKLHPESTSLVETVHIVRKYKELLPDIIKYLEVSVTSSKEMLKELQEDPFLIRGIYLSLMKGKKVGLHPTNNQETVFKNHGGIMSTKYNNIVILDVLFQTGKAQCNSTDFITVHLHQLMDSYNKYKALFFKLLSSNDDILNKKYFCEMYKIIDSIHDNEIELYQGLLIYNWTLNDI